MRTKYFGTPSKCIRYKPKCTNTTKLVLSVPKICKVPLLLIAIIAAAVSVVEAAGTDAKPAAAATTRAPPAGAKCAAIVCPAEYTPICGGLKEATNPVTKPITFGSACVLDKYNCETSRSEYFACCVM